MTTMDRHPCKECGSSDNRVLYSDGHSYCFSVGCPKPYYKNHEAVVGGEENPIAPKAPEVSPKYHDNNSSGTFKYEYPEFPVRGLTPDTCRKYGIQTAVGQDGNTVLRRRYVYYNNVGPCATKLRVCESKDFWIEGNIKEAGLFGAQLFTKGSSKYLTITEGEEDAASAYQMTGSKYACVSITRGAAHAKNEIKRNWQWVNSFDKIVLAFDADEAGQLAAVEVAKLFEPNKVLIMKMDETLKDPNGYLQANCIKEFTKAWWEAEPYTPAGIVNLASIGDKLFDEDNVESVPYPYKGLNKLLYGIRTREVVTLTAGTGAGKSTTIREIEYESFLQQTKDNIGIIALEESVKQTIWHLMSVEADLRLYLKEVRDKVPRDQLQIYQQKTVGTQRVYAFDHFGSLDPDDILERIRYMVKALGCKWIVIDHVSIIISGWDEGDERKNIDKLMTKIRSIAEETDCGILIVSHLRRTQNDKGAEDGKEISIGHLRGSQAIAQLSDAVIALERNQQADDPNEQNTTRVRVLKNRYAGVTGIACLLSWNPETGRFTELEEDKTMEFSLEDDEFGVLE